LRIAFLGTPEFAVPSLERLVEAGFDVVAAVTQPDKPKGRGRTLAAPPVKECAARLGIPVHQPTKVKDPAAVELFRSLQVDAMAVVAYGKIIPQAIIDIPPLGLVNVHSSLLPKYRGAAPMQWAIAEGETHTGVTTMLIDAGLDSGDILLTAETGIGPDENAVELSGRLSLLGADLLVQTLRGLEENRITPRPQDHEKATLAPMLTKEIGNIDWSRPAGEIHNRVRGFQPWPGAYSRFRGQSLHIWKSRLASSRSTATPGTITVERRSVTVTCGEGTGLELIEVQLEGRKRMPANAFANGQHIESGELLKGELD
jgi:methionyl-tRNA formyltransferase